MTGDGRGDRTPARIRATLADAYDRTLWTVFGDRVGLAIFLGALVFFALAWRTDFTVTDTFTLANAMVALSEGHFAIDRAFYRSAEMPVPGGVLTAPGMRVEGGRLYGEQYGQLFLALPILFVLRAVGWVADLRIALVGAWCLLVLALAIQVGTLLDRRRAGTLAGSAVALGLFAANVALAPDLDPYWTAFLALHVGTMVAGAFVGVLCYRLVGAIHDRTAGALAGTVAVLATPVGLWAAIPMRHATTTALVLAAVYWFYRSRAADSARSASRFRALAYAPVGLTAWVFAPEGLFLLVALAPVDLLTARSNAPRRLLPVGAVLFLSLVPFFATNLAIAGNPLRPPVLLDQFTGLQPVELAGSADVAPDGSGGAGPGGNGTTGGTGGSTDGTTGEGSGRTADPFTTAVSSLPSLAWLFLSKVAESVGIFVTEPGRVVRTFVRAGYVSRGPAGGTDAVNLAVLESMPVAGALVALPVALAVGVRRRSGDVLDAGAWTATARRWRSSPERSTDLLVVAVVVVFVLSYMPVLPLHAQFTVRYLTPVAALAVYGVFRLSAVRGALSGEPATFAWTYAGGVLVGGQLVVVSLATLDATDGEMVQFHALLALALAVPLGAWVALASTDRFDPDPRGGATLFGLAAAATTVFVLLGGTQYYGQASDLVIPVSRAIATGIGLS